MCGHFGLFGDLTEDDKSVFEYGLTLTQMARGRHSVGVCKVTNNYNNHITKAVGLFPNIIDLDNGFFDDNGFITGNNLRGLLGHGRHATVGEVNVDNAHPFEFDNIVGFHNGTFTEYEVQRFDKDYKKLDCTDSYALFRHLDANGGDVTKIAPSLSGSMSCVVWDKVDNKLKLWRNKERPMCLIYSTDNTKMIYTSEVWVAFYAVQRYGDIEEWDWKKSTEHETFVNKLYSVNFNEDTKSLEVEETHLTFFQHPTYTQKYASGNYGTAYQGPKNAGAKSPAQKAAETLVSGQRASLPDLTTNGKSNVVTMHNNAYFGNAARFWEITGIKDVDIAFTTPDKLRAEHGGIFVFDNVMQKFVYFDLLANLIWPNFGFSEKLYGGDGTDMTGLRPTKFFLNDKQIVGICPMNARHPLGEMMNRVPEAVPSDNIKENWVRANFDRKNQVFNFYIKPEANVKHSSYYLSQDNPLNDWMVKLTENGGEVWLTKLPRDTMSRDKLTVADLWTFSYDQSVKNSNKKILGVAS